MRALPLRLRIFAAFLLSFALFVAAMGYAQLQLNQLGHGLAILHTDYLPLSRAVAQMEGLQSRIDLKLERSGDARVDLESIALVELAQLDRLIQNSFQRIAQTSVLTKAEEERAVLLSLEDRLSLIDAAYVDYATAIEDYVALSALEDESGLESLEPDLFEAQLELQVRIEQFSSALVTAIQRVSSRTVLAQRRAVAVSGGLALAALIIGATMMALAAAALRPIGRMTDEVQRIARGDYAARVEVARRDELGVLGEEVNAMARSIQQRDEALRARARELEEARARLRSVLDTIQLGLVVTDGDAVAMANPAARALWGVAVGRSLPEALRIEGSRADAPPLGERRYDLRRAPFGGGAVLVGEDVTQKLKDRERLVRSERLALIGQMLAQITHEVRNPLNALSLNAELLTEDLAELPMERRVEAEEMLGSITDEIRRLENVTEHYLDLARLQRAEPTPHDPGALLQSVARFLEEELRRAGIAVTLDAPALPEAMLDGAQMRRALMNVIRNAAESGAERIHLQVCLEVGDLIFRVTDDGEGLSPEVGDRALEPFYSTKAQGTGLGLAITRQILEAHGGGVRVEPMAVGTRIALTLPTE